MSIKIHHGPAGSFKTSGCIADDFIPAARAGRVIVTNIRGLSDRHLVYDVLGGVPESFELHYLPTTDHEDAAKNRQAFATFFHWLPIGALMIVDEAQMIYPKSWTTADLKKLDYPGGVDQASRDKRPSDIWIAFDMHRHYNWDLIFTTTNITKIRDDIRNVADMAYRHRDMALIGWKGRYFETQHQPEDNGSSKANQITTRVRKIPEIVWKLYASTATGVHKNTVSGLAFYKSPKVVLVLLVLAYLAYSLATADPILNSHQSSKPASAPASAVVPVAPVAAHAADGHPHPGHEATLSVREDVLDPLHAYKMYIYGHYSADVDGVTTRVLFINAYNDDEYVHYKSSDLQTIGYTLKFIDKCNILLVYKTVSRLVSCSRQVRTQKTPGPGLLAVAPAADP